MQLVTPPDVSPTPQRIMGGYDGGIEVGFNGKWRSQTFEHLLPLLENARAQAQAKHGGDPIIELEGFKFHAQPHGGGKKVNYRYILTAGGTQVLIHENPEGDLQPVRIRYGAEALIGRNLFAVHERVCGWLDALGFQVEKETVSRVDLQVMVEYPVGEFFKLITAQRINTMQDLQEIEPALVAWLPELWFRLLSAPKKRGRENQQEVAPVWREVQERFREYFPGVDGVRREIIPRSKGALKCSAEHLLKQAFGCIASALAITGFKGDAKQVGEAAADLMRKDQENIYERFVKRSAKLSIAADSLQRAE